MAMLGSSTSAVGASTGPGPGMDTGTDTSDLVTLAQTATLSQLATACADGASGGGHDDIPGSSQSKSTLHHSTSRKRSSPTPSTSGVSGTTTKGPGTDQPTEQDDTSQASLTPANKRSKTMMTPERIARLEARQARNRLSAQASRDKKKNYVNHLEMQRRELMEQNTELREAQEMFWNRIQEYESRFRAIQQIVTGDTQQEDAQDQLRKIQLLIPMLLPCDSVLPSTKQSVPPPQPPLGADSAHAFVCSSSTCQPDSHEPSNESQATSPSDSFVTAHSSTSTTNTSSTSSTSSATCTSNHDDRSPTLPTSVPTSESPTSETSSLNVIEKQEVEPLGLSARLPAVKAFPSSGRSPECITSLVSQS